MIPLIKKRVHEILLLIIISLLTDYCKFFEKFISDRIQKRIESQLSEKQHAYRKNRSSHTALKELTNDIFKVLITRKQKLVRFLLIFTKLSTVLTNHY